MLNEGYAVFSFTNLDNCEFAKQEAIFYALS